jgi:glutathione synthase/RimK-type ligase-like ATP-grasp enzyme
MNYSVTIIPHQSSNSVLIMNERLAEKLNLTKKKRGAAGFGTQKNYVDILLKKDIPENEIALSTNVIENLHIPTYPSFEIRTNGNEITLGPCIGILAAKKDSRITRRTLKEISMNTLDYATIRGAIVIFALDKVDKGNHLVEGYCYNPQKNSWESGTFPYPLSIYRRSTLNEEWQNHFLSIIGDTVFSNHSFNKWDMHKWFSEEHDLLQHLPVTILYQEKNDIALMLDRYNSLYIKPIWGMKGIGVIRVSKEGNKIAFRYREDDKNIELITENNYDFENTVEKLLEPGNYILQQGLELIRFHGGIVDLRCTMQKNEGFEWINNGIVARIGAIESVVSNISSGGAAIPASELIKEALNLSEIEAFLMKNSIVSFCAKVCRVLDEYGFNFGTLGLDIGIDKDRNIWLIEVNNRRPHPAIALRANDIQSYYAILAGPMHYAKALAGFGNKGVDGHVL